MKGRDIMDGWGGTSWSMLLHLLLEDIEAMEAENSECDCVEQMEGVMHHGHNHEDGYLLDEIDEAYKGIATNSFGVGIDFDEIRKAENMYEAEDIDE